MGGHLSHLEREEHSEILDATCGPIRGNVYKHGDKIVDGYLGIPFAKPPVAELRFQKPVAAEKWSETRDCTKYGPRCPQSGPFCEMINFQKEDVADEANCLTLNVFAPRWESKEFKKRRPVMVYIHGGGFELSSSRDYCDFSVSGTLPLKDVVMVTLNYRVGILGFFTTGDDVCRGNFGLWDQTLGLEWIQKHIASFGGDPENVTIFGQSAGGGSVDILSLSPHSRDLFHGVVPMSGSAYCEFAVRLPENQGRLCREFARHIGYSGPDDSKILFEWIKARPMQEMDKMREFVVPVSGIIAFIPNFDGDFFPKPLDELRKESPKKSVMVGFAAHEGLFFDFLIRNPMRPVDALKAAIQMYYKEDTGKDYEKVREKIFDFYTKGVDLSDEGEVKKIAIDFTGDALFTAGTFATARSYLKYGNDVWFYVFDYCNPTTGFRGYEGIMPFVAPTHCTDLRYILGEGLYSEFQPTEEEWKMIEQMTTMYTNFAKYGNPNEMGSSEWEKYSLERPLRHYRIAYPRGQMRNEFQPEKMKFLEEIRAGNQNLEAVIYGR